MRVEGYWRPSRADDDSGLPFPIAEEVPWKGQRTFLAALARKEKVAKAVPYRGFSHCRICRQRNGSVEFELAGWRWPEGFCHYVELHHVRPTDEFLAFVLSNPTDERQMTMKKTTSGPKKGISGDSPATDWRAEMLERVRTLIQEADPDVVEEVKWRKPSNDMRGVPVWSHGGMICTGETYKNAVKLTFAKGASLPDPAGLFNSSLEGNTRRAIDLHEGDKIHEQALQALIRAAVALNTSAPAAARPARAQKKPKRG